MAFHIVRLTSQYVPTGTLNLSCMQYVIAYLAPFVHLWYQTVRMC